MNQLVPFNPAATNMTVSDVERVALAIAKGGLFGSKDPNAILTLCLLAQAEGQHPAVVFRDYHIIQGKPAKKAEAMLRDFISAGGRIEWHRLDDECADATFSHPGGGTARIDWTLKRAQTAGISTPMWKKYPRQMLRSRVISEGVRTVYPGATSGLYEENEVRDIGPASSEPTQELERVEAPIERQPVPGISKVKERLRAFKSEGSKDGIALADFRKLVHENRADLKAIRDANHVWWTGDGEDEEGFEAWMERRYRELGKAEEADGQYAMLIASMKECDTLPMLDNWMATNEGMIVELGDEESESFQLAYKLHKSGIMEMDKVTTGA